MDGSRQRKKPAKRSAKLAEKPCAPSGLPEEAELCEFLAQVQIVDVSLAEWENTHKTLDLEIPFYLSRQLAEQGGQAQLQFSRSLSMGQGQKSRELVVINILIPSTTKDGDRLILSGQGDRLGDTSGDAVVIFRIRRS